MPARRGGGGGAEQAAAPAGPFHMARAAWIGFDCCVLPGVTIGEGAVVGARSVVTDDVEPFAIVAGNPARLVRRLTAEEIAHGR
jgi:acetyltransferase-like isoleucine patch superfamily enzyme